MAPKASFKKILGSLAVLVFLYICVQGFYKAPEMIDEILTRLLFLIGMLFTIKVASGAVNQIRNIGQNNQLQNQQNEETITK